MGRKRIDETGKRFGRLLILEEVGRDKSGHILWKCLCDCGTIKIVSSDHLRSGHTKSCGCLQKEKIFEMNSGKNNHNFGKNFSGTNGPNYNPNITDKERRDGRFYPEYKIWRTAVYERDDYTCQCCGKRGGKLAAHHLESYADNPELRTLLENKECHKNFHHQYGKGNNTKKQFKKFFTQHNKIFGQISSGYLKSQLT